ncbi:SCO2322 family protein [Nocardioides perillae]|uniref:MYXO-CTERM domain-containing protein n=1 Tax=Nocardioides perillae TaxID=1119534 RepID=A0A7Y9RVK6_9ACTN|nr:SCO2322 family protein [Nocardioides perillae]NYG55653.1 hypothetical protein [Nocardioides perillae]
MTTRTPRTARPLRRVTAAVATAAVAALVAVTGSLAPAQADGEAQIYRYWGYFHVEGGEYVTSEVGLADFVPEDGAVEALRYAAPADFTAPNLPRADLETVTFDAVCAEETAAEGEKRVAVVLDYGVEADSEGAVVPEPSAACAVVPESANALQAVSAVAETRTDDGGLLCAVGGYPASGCGGVVDTATPADGEETVDFAIAGLDQGDALPTEEFPGDQSLESADEAPSDAWLYLLLPAVVLTLVIGGIVLARRRTADRRG